MEDERLQLCDVSVSSGNERRPQPVSRENDRIVQVDHLRTVRKLERGEAERHSSPDEHLRYQALSPEAGELLDDCRGLAICEVQASVHIGVVVPAVALMDPGEPERAFRLGRSNSLAPREAAVQDHANESARSARIARISSSVLPVLTRSTGRRSPRFGLTPRSHARAASGS